MFCQNCGKELENDAKFCMDCGQQISTRGEGTAPDAGKSEKTLTMILYALYAVSLLTGITALIAVAINYAKKDDVAGTFIESHFQWQIRTFWFGLLWGVLGALTTVFIVGVFILIADLVWIIYRVAKGWFSLDKNKAMPTA